jgi:hypothetical protein
LEETEQPTALSVVRRPLHPMIKGEIETDSNLTVDWHPNVIAPRANEKVALWAKCAIVRRIVSVI